MCGSLRASTTAITFLMRTASGTESLVDTDNTRRVKVRSYSIDCPKRNRINNNIIHQNTLMNMDILICMRAVGGILHPPNAGQ